ncbi:hypothetical protein A6A06_16305 [Streptomyces sp. CB02923]|uniref:hypothetical protein n=1 Tax=Streptomyces sp. CB02923 TaxID=1718985 RepID=UPI00093F4D98|nr:hypothetical protein [Streptomyces sp. CB02923]OKI02574.1 hypothetical protein A6A06_16305 [Streptomyces sp. CB02923]
MKRLTAALLAVGASLALATPAVAVAAPQGGQAEGALWINPNKPCTVEGKMFGSIRAPYEFAYCKKIGERPSTGSCGFAYFDPIKLFCVGRDVWDYPDFPGDGRPQG